MLVLAYDFTLPLARDVGYRFDGEDYRVDCALEGDLRIAYVSCNGQESGDRKRSLDARNVLWRGLARQHEQAPFHRLMQGGDQLFADDVASPHKRASPKPLAAWQSRVDSDYGRLREGDRTERFRRPRAHPQRS